MKKKSKRKYRKLLLALLSIVVFFGITELLCRALNLSEKVDTDFKFYVRHVDNDLECEFMTEDPLLMWRPLKLYDSSQHAIKISSQGFRDYEYHVRKPHDTFRILCLGDSTTFGAGVVQEATYHSLLETELNRNAAGTRHRFEIINGGCTGYTSAQGLALYRYHGRRLKPDVVTFYFGINDPLARFHLSDDQIMQSHLPRPLRVFTNTVLLRSHFFRWFRKVLLNVMPGREPAQEARVARVSLENYRRNIVALSEQCSADGAALILVSPALCKERTRGWHLADDITRYRRELENIAKERDLPLLFVKEMTEEAETPTEGLFIDKVHPNGPGHMRLAQALHSLLLDRGLLPGSKPPQ